MTWQRTAWAVLALIPLAVLLRMWLVTGGLPYNTDSNESFSAFAQGQSLLNFSPWANAFLPDDAVGYHAAAHPFTYTHGPNLPRYFSALFSLAGVQGLEWQILISGMISVLLSLWFIARSFPEPLDGSKAQLHVTVGLVIAALFALDFIGVWQFLGNLWRTWHFPLFWGCIWAARTRPRWWAGFMLFFLTFQLEFLFATFTALTVACYLLWTHRRTWRELLSDSYLGMAAGIVASLAVFAGQLIAFYGWRGFLFDLQTTYIARNTNQVSWDSIREFYESHGVMMWASSPDWDLRFRTYLSVTWENMSSRLTLGFAVVALASVLLSIILAVAATLRRGAVQPVGRVNASLGPLLWAMVVAYLILGVVLPGYTLNGYTWRWAPLLVFPVTLALALLAANVAGLIAAGVARGHYRVFRDGAAAIVIAPLLALWLANSIYQYGQHPDFIHWPAAALASTYKGHSFVSATTFPHMIAHYTGRWAYYSKPVFPGDQRLDQSDNWNADRNKNPDYERPEYYLCEALPYATYLSCDDVARQMAALGHEPVERGPNYVIVKLNWRLPAQLNNESHWTH